ncbi:lipid-A-disaccharide synthase [Alteromonas lipotrueiana]|uniref:lipid-A-disaccharide synthase n=1 Tax=Alteromonas lipotrueiana TaxID=2803815 RepID=UPI001C43E25E|nr:lipid-A-disaccharide synthase [Alteromonas lipotrueiana]
MNSRPLRIGIVAGEPSGDVLAAGMIAQIKQQHPDAIIEGIGGDNMIAAGCRSLFDMETLSVMGLFEVLAHLPAILKIKKNLIAHFDKYPPDIFVGVDAPDFNLRVEKALKQKGIKTVHYVSPTVWAWRENRIHKIAQATHCVLGLFPFEEQVYKKYQVPYRFVGHTLADAIELEPSQKHAREALNLATEVPVMAVLPGSRRGEVAKLLPIFLATIECVLKQKPECKFVIAAANQHRYTFIDNFLNEHAKALYQQGTIVLVKGQARQAMIASDVILLASGTATLEAMLCKRPMVATYKLSPMTYKIMQRLYKAPFFTLPNLLANEKLVPELLQDEVNPQNLGQQLLDLLNRDNSALVQKFTEIHQTLAVDADKVSAQAVLDLIPHA